MAQRTTTYEGPERRAADVRIVVLEGRMEGHEAVCAERYQNIERRLGEHKEAVSKLYSGAWWIAGTLLVAMGGGFFALFMKIADAGKHLVN